MSQSHPVSRRVRGSWILLAAVASSTARGGDVPESAYSDLHWRSVGPLRGGWATCASGVPGEANTFYFGAADGGVWRTTDAGRTWQGQFQHESVAAIGALVVAPSDPRVLYVGTGQVTTRWDVTSGNGVYRSGDGGESWNHCGLPESEHVGRLWVDPRDADVVLVAALGHLWGPNEERGVFRSKDGGAHWERVLFVDENTGAVDLSGDPSEPDVLFAATWQARRFPWQAYFTPLYGPGSGVWRSMDAGATWHRLEHCGLPEGSVGRIGLAVAPNTQARCVYATVDAAEGAGLYRSDDGGDTWRCVNPDPDLASDYFAMAAVHPREPDTLHVMGRSIRTSTDGGQSFHYTRGSPGGDDYHFLWIDPDHPERRIAASDQGAVVTVNDGESWSSWYNQPTGQFYRVAVDDRFPYWIYSGQQDSGTVAAASRSDYGQLTFRDWHPVGGDERDYDIPFPGQPEIVYGSGLGGKVTRWDERTGQVKVVSPWPVSSYGARPTTVRYRSTWLSPLAISKVPPHAIYQAAQVLFRSLDGGDTWDVISPDLTGAVEGTVDPGGDVPVAEATALGFGVIFSIAPSQRSADTIWVGTDNGRIHRTEDSGKHWQDVTPAGLGDWSKIASLDLSATDDSTAVAAVDRHRLDDWRPLVLVTHDGGRTWRESHAGLPDHEYSNVVRTDPVRAGLLYAGTSAGVFVSFDDGLSWQSLQLDLPTTGVNDLVVHEDDLVIATEGRALWVLDDVTPLRTLDAERLAAPAVLLPPATAFRLSPNQNRDTPLPTDEPRAENPPAGAVIDYVLPRERSALLVLEVLDARGAVVRRFRSDRGEGPLPADQYFPDEWLPRHESLPARTGHNRFVWNLRTERPKARSYEYSIAAVPGADTPELPQGLFVPPGRYTLRLSLGDWSSEQPLEVRADPRAPVVDLAVQAEFYRQLGAWLAESVEACEEIETLRGRLAALAASDTGELANSARELHATLESFLGGDTPDDLATAAGNLTALATDVESCDALPTRAQRLLAEEESTRLRGALERWHALRAGSVRALHERLRAAGRPGLFDSDDR